MLMKFPISVIYAGDESAVPCLGGGAQGYSLYDKIFMLHLQFDEHLCIDTYAILSLVH